MDIETTMRLTRVAASQLHLSGLILATLVERGLLTDEQARAMVADAQDKLDDGNPFETAFSLLQNEFRK